MNTITINNVKYEIINNYKEAIDEKILEEKITDYYDDYTYIVGDWAYGKVRLKGYYDETDSKVKPYNSIKDLDEYIKNNCAYGCKWFCIKKVIEK